MEPTHPCPCQVPTPAAPPRRLSAGSARPGRCPEGGRAVGIPGWELSLRGAQLGASNTTGCPSCCAPCPPRTPPSPQRQGKPLSMFSLPPSNTQQGQGKPPAVPLLPPKTPAPPHLPGQPCSGASTRSTNLRGEGTSSAKLGVLPPAAGTKEGAGSLGCTPGVPPYPRKPAGCAPSPRSAAGGDAPWCAGSSTRLREEGLGVGDPCLEPLTKP